MKPEFERADPAALAAFDSRTKACTMNCGPSFEDPRSPEERRFLCPDCETVKLPRQQDFDWADRQLPDGIARQDVCIWTQDSDGPWNTSCGVTWEFVDGGPAENGAHFCHHCGGVLMAATFADDDAQPNYALMEAAMNEAVDAYFKARPQIDGLDMRRVFEAGFKAAWKPVEVIEAPAQLVMPTREEVEAEPIDEAEMAAQVERLHNRMAQLRESESPAERRNGERRLHTRTSLTWRVGNIEKRHDISDRRQSAQPDGGAVGKVLSDAEMGVGYDRKFGDVIWWNKPKGPALLYTHPPASAGTVNVPREPTHALRVYLAGPMRGIPEYNFPAFYAAAKALRDIGCEVWSPAENDVEKDGFDPTKDKAQPMCHYMRRDLPAVLNSDAVVVLPGWEKSEGAQLEAHVAKKCGIPIHELDAMLAAKDRT